MATSKAEKTRKLMPIDKFFIANFVADKQIDVFQTWNLARFQGSSRWFFNAAAG
uniref:hypothetical protein n=1 Tax=Alloprevotella sp. TaxID=1872471 RepID=UPI003FEDC5A0